MPQAPQTARRALFGLAFVAAGLATGLAVLLLREPSDPYWKRRPRAVPPPADAVAVYAYGDSTMEGAPYPAGMGIPTMVERCFAGRTGPRTVRVQNLAFSSNVLSEDPADTLLEVLERADVYRPAAVLLYAGHIEPTPKGGGTRAERGEARARRYRNAVQALAVRAREAGVPLLVGLPISNAVDLPPVISDCPTAAEPGCSTGLAAADDALDRGAPRAALEILEPLLEAAPENALVRYLRGRALLALGRDDDAEAMFEASLGLDQADVRVEPSMLRALLALCAEGLATCVDARPEILARYGHADRRLFADAHHPNPRGYAVLGRAFATTLATRLGLPEPECPDPERLPGDLASVAASVDTAVRLQVTGLCLMWAALARPDVAARTFLGRAEETLQPLEGAPLDARQAQVAAFRRLVLAALRGDRQGVARWKSAALAEPLPDEIRPWLADRVVAARLHGAGIELGPRP